MELYRIALTKYCDDLSGYGAYLNGGRWNPVGLSAMYTSTARSLAILEIIANMNQVPQNVSFSLTTLIIEKEYDILKIEHHTLPKNWQNRNYISQTVQLGRDWLLQKESLLLEVPSCLVYEEKNMIINPMHSDFVNVKIKEIREFEFDKRLR